MSRILATALLALAIAACSRPAPADPPTPPCADKLTTPAQDVASAAVDASSTAAPAADVTVALFVAAPQHDADLVTLASPMPPPCVGDVAAGNTAARRCGRRTLPHIPAWSVVLNC